MSQIFLKVDVTVNELDPFSQPSLSIASQICFSIVLYSASMAMH